MGVGTRVGYPKPTFARRLIPPTWTTGGKRVNMTRYFLAATLVFLLTGGGQAGLSGPSRQSGLAGQRVSCVDRRARNGAGGVAAAPL